MIAVRLNLVELLSKLVHTVCAQRKNPKFVVGTSSEIEIFDDIRVHQCVSISYIRVNS